MSERRTAVVTGASSGVGVAIARAFAAQGWAVAIGARRGDRLAEVAKDIEAAGGRVQAGFLDVARADSIDAFFTSVESSLGSPDIVVSNAGLGKPGLLHELSVEDIQEEVAVNLVGTMLVARRAIPSMIARRSGDLVFISSMTVVEPRTFQSGYAATKSGVEGLARVLRMELEGTGVRSTVLRLGPTRSEFGFGWPPDTLLRVIESWTACGQMRQLDVLEPEDVAAVVVGAVTAAPGVGNDVIQLNPTAKAVAT